ncbi:MAG: glycosyltransferase family 1 protein [Bacteroidetes bacterium]|nr:glycosyltransferase family 1 protein [Bacteroidota bacterium]
MVKERQTALLRNKLRYEKIPGLPDHVIAAQPPLTFPINWLPKGSLYTLFWKKNNQIILNTIRQVIEDHDINNYIYLNCFNPYFAGVLPDSFRPLLNIYQCIDDMTQETYTSRHGARLEEDVIRQADITFVTSRNLKKLKSPLNSNTHILHNAVDMKIFQNAVKEKLPCPEQLKGIQTKIIGFTGNMDAFRINYPLLRKVALAHKDKTLVLVGPINNEDYKKYELDNLSNVVFTGRKDIKELPRYLQHFDCAIIPFLCNKLTASIYPLKINEYLAAGKAVVSTNFSEDIRSFDSCIYIAENEDAFITLIDNAISENTTEKINARVNVANSNTWTARVEQFWTIVNKHLEEKASKNKLTEKQVL